MKGQGSGGGDLTSPQVLVLGQGGPAGRRMTTLAELISSSKAAGIWHHQAFTAAGVPPPQLTVKRVHAFMPTGALKDVFPRLVRHVQAGSKVSLLWAVTVKPNGKIMPYGLALVAAKQILAKAGGTSV